MNDSWAVVLVYSTSYAIRIEGILKRGGIPGRLVPVPRQLSSDCGVCVRIAQAHKEAVREALSVAQVEFIGIEDIHI
jgi:hypothetical protein